MAKLWYGSYEELLHRYIEPRLKLADITRTLLKSGLKEQSYDLVDDLSDSTLTFYRQGKREINVIDLYCVEDVLERVEPYFAANVTKYIADDIKANLLRDLTDLISSDGDIAYEQKKVFAQLASRDTFNDFLSRVFVYAIRQKPAPQRAVDFPLNNLPLANNYFTGRDELIGQIRESFISADLPVRMQTIYGLSGIGKTQIALKYAHYFAGSYDTIWLVDAENASTITKSFMAFLSLQGLMPEDKSLDTIRDAFVNWFNTHDSWLLIYDNALYFSGSDSFYFQGCLPSNDQVGHILMTTIVHQPYRDELFRKIDEFSEECAIEFLRKRTGIVDEQNAALLAKRLYYLPLALEQAGAYIVENRGVDYGEYIKLLDELGVQLLDNDDRLVNYRLSVWGAWRIAKGKINIGNAFALLYFCSYMHPDSIDVSLFEKSIDSKYLPVDLPEDDALRRVEINKMILELTKYSLCSYDGTNLSMHGLLQEVVRFPLTDDIGKIVVDACFRTVYDLTGFAYEGDEAASLAPHVIELIGHIINQLDEKNDDILDRLHDISEWLMRYALFYDTDIHILTFLQWPMKVIEKKMKKVNRKETRLAIQAIAPRFQSQISSMGAMPIYKFLTYVLHGGEVTAQDEELVKLWSMYWLIFLLHRVGMIPETRVAIQKAYTTIKEGNIDAFKNDPLAHLILMLMYKATDNPDITPKLREIMSEKYGRPVQQD